MIFSGPFVKRLRNYYLALAPAYLLINWVAQSASHGVYLSNIYTQRLVVETLALLVNLIFLILYILYENAWIRKCTIVSQILIAGLYGFCVIDMLIKPAIDFSAVTFIAHAYFLYFSIIFSYWMIKEKTDESQV